MKLFPDWIDKLTLQQQTVLALALRGPDGFPKHHASKPVLYFLRACLLRQAHTGRMMKYTDSCPTFMSMAGMDIDFWRRTLRDFQEVEDEMPLHYYTHLMHAAEVLAFKHPDPVIRNRWMTFYLQCCEYLHLVEETEEQMDLRLNDFGRIDDAILEARAAEWERDR